MNKSGIGVGSASIVLIFAVLCLTVFSMITLVVARNDKTLADTEAKLVTGYYEADTFAERILVGIIEAGYIPDTVQGIIINSGWDEITEREVVSYLCPVSDKKELLVKLVIDGDFVEIIDWRMLDIGEWQPDDSLDVWLGDDLSTDIWFNLD